MLAFLVYKNSPIYNPFVDSAEKLGVKLDIITYSNLEIAFDNNTCSIKHKGVSLKSYEGIYLRNAQKEPELSLLVSEFCRQNNIPIIDRVFTFKKPWIDNKSFEYARLTEKKLPTIDSIVINRDQIPLAMERFVFPIVVKETDNSQGRGVHLVQDENELSSVFNNAKDRLLVQKYIENDGDYRLLVIGGQLVASIKRTRVDPSKFLNNISQGALGTIHNPTQKEKDIAIMAADLLEYDIAGVDLIYDNDEIKILEVNRAPSTEGTARVTGIDNYLLTIKHLIKVCKHF